MNTNTTTNKAEELISVMGGVKLEVEYRESESDGRKRTETVLVRELGADQMLDYFRAIDFEGTCAELYCAKPKGWADTITRDSLTAIIEKGEGLNPPFLAAWRKRQFARQEVINPLLIRAIADSLQKNQDGSALLDSSSESPSAPVGQSLKSAASHHVS